MADTDAAFELRKATQALRDGLDALDAIAARLDPTEPDDTCRRCGSPLDDQQFCNGDLNPACDLRPPF